MRWLKRIGRKIWNRIVRTFGNKKMKINATIDRWFEETFTRIAGKLDLTPDNPNQIDLLCVSALKTCHDYSRAALLLLANGHEYPTKALMRCQCELIVKLTWILRVADDESEQTAEDGVRERIERWLKSTYSQGIKLAENFMDAVAVDEREQLERDAKNLIILKEKIPFNEMPNLVQLFEGLPEPFKSEMYPILYDRFNDAIHVDLKSMTSIYRGRQGGSAELEKYCAAYAFNINSLVRLNYDLKIDEIKEEYHKIM